MDECHRFGINDGCKIDCPVLCEGNCRLYEENKEMLSEALFNGEDVLCTMELYEDMDVNLNALKSHAINWMMELDDYGDDDWGRSEKENARSIINDFMMYLAKSYDKEASMAEKMSRDAEKLVIDANKMRNEAFDRLSIKKEQ